MSVKDKWVRRFTVNETANHRNFTIYKITSVLFPLQHPDAATIISVWKRYSDVQKLHKSMRSLHSGLHLNGSYPALPSHSYFKRFQKEVIEQRAHSIKILLEFIAQHKLLFASAEFVNFLQTGYPEPHSSAKISMSLVSTSTSCNNLSILDQPNEEENSVCLGSNDQALKSADTIDCLSISKIKIYEPDNVEIKVSTSNSLESIDSLSISSDLYEEINKTTIDNMQSKTKSVLPDLINFQMPSTSTSDVRKVGNDSETESLSSTIYDNCGNTTFYGGSIIYGNSSRVCDDNSVVCGDDSVVCGDDSVVCGSEAQSIKSTQGSLSNKSLSISRLESKTRIGNSYIFEAGHILNLATRCEDIGEYKKAFEYYKIGIEKLLNGVKNDSDPERRSLIKQKINKYLTYAETVCTKHLQGTQFDLNLEEDSNTLFSPLPLSMLERPYEELSLYKVRGILGPSVMLVQNRDTNSWYAMKVVQKVPINLTDFDDYYTQQINVTKTPILPTTIPYMVTLHSYIQTENLIFLIMTYLPGIKLIQYIKSHKNEVETSSRNVDLNNVFAEPKMVKGNTDLGKESGDLAVESEDEISKLVIQSKKLIVNVDKVLNNSLKDNSEKGKSLELTEKVVRTVEINQPSALPPAAICKWGAEILTAIESLHDAGVVCRDLNPNNILLGNKGQATLTYLVGYAGSEMTLSKVHKQANPQSVDMYIAPELYRCNMDLDKSYDEKVCDFWSFGAIMYEMLCGVSLSHHHRSVFNAHTELFVPKHVAMEAKSLLTQLLTHDPAERLGAGTDGIFEIKHHPYFKSIDWPKIRSNWLAPVD